MANTTRKIPSPSPTEVFDPMYDFASEWSASIARAQRTQVEAFEAWQKSVTQLNQELWDAWACRWAGGLPIDA
jgi:hypothetical protein